MDGEAEVLEPVGVPVCSKGVAFVTAHGETAKVIRHGGGRDAALKERPGKAQGRSRDGMSARFPVRYDSRSVHLVAFQAGLRFRAKVRGRGLSGKESGDHQNEGCHSGAESRLHRKVSSANRELGMNTRQIRRRGTVGSLDTTTTRQVPPADMVASVADRLSWRYGCVQENGCVECRRASGAPRRNIGNIPGKRHSRSVQQMP
jgi:hypothetical protein